MYRRDSRKIGRHRSRVWWSRIRLFGSETQAGPVVEFAIIVPVLLLLVLGAVDLGRAFFMRNNLVSAVREGARFAAVQKNPCTAESAIRDRVRFYFTDLASPKPANTSAAIPITFEPNCANPNAVTAIKVKIATYPYTPITPFFRLLNRSGTINLSDSATFRWERSP